MYYIGKVPHKGNVYNGVHKAIISEELFNDVQKIKQTNRSGRLMTSKECYVYITLPNQYKQVIYLSPAYNVFCDIDYDEKLLLPNYKTEDLSKAFKTPEIYHYVGGNKPWINNHVKHFYEIWWNYAQKSPWYKKIKKKKKSHENGKIILLFNIFPLFSCEHNGGRIVYKICGIPIWKIRKVSNNRTTKYYFCGVSVCEISKK